MPCSSESVERHRVRQQVAVVGDLDDRLVAPVASTQQSLKNRDTLAFRMRKRYLRVLHFEIRLVGQVHGHHVAQEAVEVEDVEVQLSAGVKRLVGQHQVDVIVQVAKVVCGAARQAQVHAVIDRLIAAIQAAVDVEHGGVALVHVLRGEAEHVIVEPVRAHGLTPVARDIDEAAAAVGRAGPVDR